MPFPFQGANLLSEFCIKKWTPFTTRKPQSSSATSRERILLPILFSPHKEWGWKPIPDLHWLNIWIHKLKFHMVTLASRILSGRGHIVCRSWQEIYILWHKHSPIPQKVSPWSRLLPIQSPSIWASYNTQGLYKSLFSWVASWMRRKVYCLSTPQWLISDGQIIKGSPVGNPIPPPCTTLSGNLCQPLWPPHKIHTLHRSNLGLIYSKSQSAYQESPLDCHLAVDESKVPLRP